jgi:hypothetical protein
MTACGGSTPPLLPLGDAAIGELAALVEHARGRAMSSASCDGLWGHD